MPIQPLTYLTNKSRSHYQWIVPEEKLTDCLALSGSSFFWEQDEKSLSQYWIFIPIGPKGSNKFFINMGGGPGLLIWFGGIGRPKDMSVWSAEAFDESKYIYELRYIDGEGEDARYNIIQQESGDYLARIGGGRILQPDLKIATLWSKSGKDDQVFRIKNIKPFTQAPDFAGDLMHPLNYIEEKCAVKSWEHDVPRDVEEVTIGESYVPYMFLEEGNIGLRFTGGPYYKLKRSIQASQWKPMTQIKGSAEFTLNVGEESSQSSHSITTIMEKLHIGIKAGGSIQGVNLGADIAYDLNLTKSEGTATIEGNSSSQILKWNEGTDLRVAYWKVSETFAVYDHQETLIGTPYITSYKTVTYWSDK